MTTTGRGGGARKGRGRPASRQEGGDDRNGASRQTGLGDVRKIRVELIDAGTGSERI
jgi:hypothetical protein